MLDQPWENEYWSASCVMYGAGPYTSFRFLFSMRTTTSWSKLFVAEGEMMTLPPWSTGRFAGAFEARTVRLRSMRRAEAVRAANTRLGGAIPYFPGGLQHQESRSC